MSGSVTLVRAAGNQRRAVALAGVMAAAGLWIPLVMGRWQVGIFLAAGVVVGLANAVLTELSLMRSLEDRDAFTRKQFTVTSLVRLMAISAVAVVLALVFWPDGAATLVGLAAFHVVTLVLTGIPLLKELHKA